jgi:hypothetical protein
MAGTTTGPARRSCHQVAVTADGITFLSCKANLYISLNIHRSATSTKHDKSIWDVSRPDECHTFCNAELGGWIDSEGDYWSISKDGATVLGTRGERVAFFDSPVNQTDPWHGYPVGGRRGLPTVRRPPDDIIRLWFETGWISYVTYSRLMGGRL